jgi:L-alanine-DL-glutamate epimerase-like enolase superfamily enzyme
MRCCPPLLADADPRRTEALWEQMWWHLHYVGRGGIASFRHLGGGRRAVDDPRVKVYAGGIDLQLPLEQLLEQTEANLRRGFRAIKMKVGRESLREDVERVVAVRASIGPAIPLMVDANMRWTVAQAIRASHAFAAHGVYWLEEPAIPDDMQGYRRNEAEAPHPVAAGENLH